MSNYNDLFFAKKKDFKNFSSKRVDLSKLMIKKPPIPYLSSFKSLTSLDLSQNILDSTLGLHTLTSLTLLSLSHNTLENLNPDLGHLTNLTFLSVSHNSLTKIPSSFSNLVELKTLNLSHNMFNRLPSSLGDLVKLEVLNLSFNSFVHLPKFIASLPKLRELIVNNNPLNFKLSKEAPKGLRPLLDAIEQCSAPEFEETSLLSNPQIPTNSSPTNTSNAGFDLRHTQKNAEYEHNDIIISQAAQSFYFVSNPTQLISISHINTTPPSQFYLSPDDRMILADSIGEITSVSLSEIDVSVFPSIWSEILTNILISLDRSTLSLVSKKVNFVSQSGETESFCIVSNNNDEVSGNHLEISSISPRKSITTELLELTDIQSTTLNEHRQSLRQKYQQIQENREKEKEIERQREIANPHPTVIPLVNPQTLVVTDIPQNTYVDLETGIIKNNEIEMDTFSHEIDHPQPPPQQHEQQHSNPFSPRRLANIIHEISHHNQHNEHEHQSPPTSPKSALTTSTTTTTTTTTTTNLGSHSRLQRSSSLSSSSPSSSLSISTSLIFHLLYSYLIDLSFVVRDYSVGPIPSTSAQLVSLYSALKTTTDKIENWNEIRSTVLHSFFKLFRVELGDELLNDNLKQIFARIYFLLLSPISSHHSS